MDFHARSLVGKLREIIKAPYFVPHRNKKRISACITGQHAMVSKASLMTSLQICLLNPWSVCNKAAITNDFIIDQNIDIFALTETWLTGTDQDDPTLAEVLSRGFSIKQVARKQRGGGVTLIHRDTLNM
jgi:hypothetical protein